MEGEEGGQEDSDSDFNPGVEVEEDDPDVDMADIKAEEDESPGAEEEDFVPSKIAAKVMKRAAPKATIKSTPKKMPVKKTVAAPKAKDSEDRKVALKDRFNLFYGFDEPERVKGNDIRDTWGNISYSWDPAIMTPNVVFETPPDMEISVEDQYRRQSSTPFMDSPASPMILLNGDGDETTLPALSSAPFKSASDTPSGASSVINAGAPVSSVAWAYGHSESQYLAAATLNSSLSDPQTGLPEPTDPTFKAFANMSGDSAIQIWQFSPSPRLTHVISFDYGFAWDLAFQPRNQDDTRDTIGLLAAVFQDGSVRVFDVPYSTTADAVEHIQLQGAYRTFALGNSKATCLAWRGPTRVVVGYSDGKIAEFDVTDLDEETALIPSYIVSVHTTYIASVATAYPKNPEFVFTSSPDGFCKLYDVTDPRHTRAINLRVIDYTPAVAYQSHISSFTCLEDSETVRVLPTRQTSLYKSLTSVTRHQTHAMSVGTSINHPFVISGGSDGTLAMGNCVRRVMVGARYTHSYGYSVLWRFEYSKKENKYRLFEGLRSDGFVKAQANAKNRVTFPDNVAVTCVQWNNNVVAGGWYAAGLTSGLIRVDSVV